MTAPRYTADQLHAMSGRELDAVVAEVVMGVEAREPKRCHHTGAVHHEELVIRPGVPFYSMTWAGLGQIVDRLSYLEIDFLLESVTDDENRKLFHVWVGDPRDSGQGFNEFASVTAPTLPRATAIAAVLAVQGVG